MRSVKSHIFLQIIPVTISNGSRTVTTNAFLDSGSDSILISIGLAEKLNLNGATKTIKIQNVLNNEMSYKPKLVNFFISSKQHPKIIPIANPYSISAIELPINKLPIAQIKEKWDGIRDIELSELSSSCEVGVLIGADMPKLLLQHDIRIGNFDAPAAVKITLGWVLIGEKHANSVNTSIVAASKLNMNYDNDFNKQVEKFWSVESYGTMKPYDKENMTKEERKAVKILETTTTRSGNRYEVGFLWKENNAILNYNKGMALHRLHLTERKFTTNNELAMKYKGIVNEYISKGNARKLSQEEANRTSPITNYISHYGIQNPNKTGKLRVLFDAATYFNYSCLNDHLLSGPNLLNNLIGLFLRFREGKYAGVSDIEQMFHQISVRREDQDALRFLWQNDKKKAIEDHIICVQVFGKIDSPCIANWKLKRTARDSEEVIRENIIDQINSNFYMDDFLSSHSSIERLSATANVIIKVLSNGGFRLKKWLSNNKSFL